MKRAEGELLKNVEYMKEQCNDSEIRDLASEAKSLLRVTRVSTNLLANWKMERTFKIVTAQMPKSWQTGPKTVIWMVSFYWMTGEIYRTLTDTSGFGMR